MDLRRVCVADKAFGVATPHYLAAVEVRVAQKPCQLRPGSKGHVDVKSCDQQDDHDWLKEDMNRQANDMGSN